MHHSPPKPRTRLWRFILCLFGALLGGAAFLAGFLWAPASVHYQITERYAFTASEDAQVALAVLLPRSGPYQEVSPPQVTWEGSRQQQAEAGVDVLRLHGSIGADGSAEAAIAYSVRLRQGPARWSGPVEDGDLLPEAEIEADDPAIRSLARELAGGSTPEDALRIHRFVAGYLSWPTGPRFGSDQSALQALETGIGGCGEFANLTVALCRAAGIPARSVGGLAFLESAFLPPYFPARTRTWLHPAGAHAWVECYAGGQWRMADPSWASYGLPTFGRSDGNHLSYGQAGEERAAYERAAAWACALGHPAAGMSAPLKFASGASAEGVRVTPVVSVRKGWDGRWLNGLLGALLAGTVLRLAERALRRWEGSSERTAAAAG